MTPMLDRRKLDTGLFDARLFDVRSRAPLRLGLAGGGTDLSPYCDQFGGAVLNATIDRFAFAHVTRNPEGRIAFRASDIGGEESYASFDEVGLEGGLILHKAVYRHVVETYLDGRAPPLIVSTTIDAPAGSGLGSSSALVVALIEAFRVALDLPLGPYEVARLAFDIERVKLGLAGGRQDQYAATFGGFNYIEFLPGERTLVNPLRAPRAHLNEFESSLVICFSGQSRRSDTIIQEQIDGLVAMNPETVENMHRLKEDAALMKDAILRGRTREVAEILLRSWAAKKRTAKGIATDTVDRLFELAMAHGAWGGKVSGAGGGGFLMFCTDPENRFRLIQTLNAAGGQASSVKLTFDGAEAWTVPR
ncbi:dehydrogenase [Phenylobacterium aquaticum]|uniref:GHMP family kinase ATP-binding protein n=1 Tax=Phenylobacterium aquaticum TaxID=1763816 RepID=UPI0026EA84B5|nr:dehydrogenase [Phenylobacterium aquaticum]